MSKNIIILSDGTSQKGGVGYNTNVYKLFNMLEDRTPNQIVYYDPGLGTDNKGILGAITGLGFAQNILECYRFLFENYQAGDKVFLFGFSRGAATVRSLSGFVHLFGILPQSRPDLLKEAFSIYKIRDEKKREKQAKEFIARHHTMWLKIKFIGVWDTVAALGLPNKFISSIIDKFLPHRFHSFGLSDSIEFARHAISIDDERKTFHPVIWDALPEGHPNERMKQVWFAGVHTDVGGGYKEQELSHFTMKWMLGEAMSKGLLIYKNSDAWQDFQKAEYNVDGKIHNEQSGILSIVYKREQRGWDEKRHGKIVIHESVLQRKKNANNTEDPAYKPWVLSYSEREIEPMNQLQYFDRQFALLGRQ